MLVKIKSSGYCQCNIGHKQQFLGASCANLWARTHLLPSISRQRDWAWALHLVTHFPLTGCKSCHFSCLMSENDGLDCNWRISNSPSPFLLDFDVFWQMQTVSLFKIKSNVTFLFPCKSYIWDFCQCIVKSQGECFWRQFYPNSLVCYSIFRRNGASCPWPGFWRSQNMVQFAGVIPAQTYDITVIT